MNHFLFDHSIKLCLALALTTTCSVRAAGAENPLQTQDQALAWALENHPDIVAAKAKVALANAELYSKRIEVSRQVLGLYGSMKKLDAQVGASKSKLALVKAASEQGHATPTERQEAELQLVKNTGEREQLEKELRLLVGTTAPPSNAVAADKATNVPRQMPKGPIVEKMKVALEKPLKLDFADTPLSDIMAYLTDKVGISFSLQKMALENAGIGFDQPTTLRTSEVSLQAAIEAFQDASPDLVFVLRDYGVLLTPKEYADEHGYTPVLELEKQLGATVKGQ